MIIVCDLETTGTNVFDAEIITGSFLAVDDSFRVVSELDIFCNPFKWSDEAERVHGISRETAAQWPDFRQCYDRIVTFIQANQGKEFWCHAKSKAFGKLTFFDYAVLKLRMAELSDDAYFTMLGLKPYSTHSLAKVSGIDFEKYSLDHICNRLDITLQHHDAKSDALACLEIMKRLLPMTNREAIYNFEREIENDESNRSGTGNRKKSRRSKSID